MHSPNTFSIDFVLRKCKTETRFGLIYARITVNSVIREISIKERIPVSIWNSESESVTGKTPAIKLLNQTIENVRFRLKENTVH